MIEHKNVYVLGAGGHAKVVIATLRAAGYTDLQVLDDDAKRHGEKILGVPISGPLAVVDNPDAGGAVIAIGDNRIRREVAQRFGKLEWVTVVHPTTIIDPTATIGTGSVIFAGAIIQPDTVIGAHAIINTGATIDHDCRIGDYGHVGPGCHLCGNVTLGEGTLLGVGSVAIPGIKIGAWTTVGAGSVIVDDLASGIIAAGIPAKPTHQ